MNHPASFPPPFRLHDWLIQPDLNRISGADGPVQIEPRVMAVLLTLAARPGAVVTRLELLDAVWGDAVVGEEILTRAVSELRRVFGDEARQPIYIETIRSNGYRLIAPVVPAAPPAEEAIAPPITLPAAPVDQPTLSPADAVTADPPRRRPSRLSVFLVLAAAIPVTAAGFLFLRPAAKPATQVHLPAAVPLTAYPGREYHPALSPDGTRVAFAWTEPGAGHSAIHIKQRNSETPLRLGDSSGWTAWPTWSPDGQTVAFVQTTDTVSTICLVSSLGGAVRQVHPVAHLIEGLDWSADGNDLAFAARDSVSGQFRVFVLDLARHRVRRLADERADERPDGSDRADDVQPRYSPDGRQLAWLGRSGSGGAGVYLAAADGTAARALVAGRDELQGLAWTPDGRSLVYAAAAAGVYSLWMVPVDGGPPAAVPIPGDFAWNPTIARLSGDLVFEQVRVDQDLWRVAVQDRTTWDTTAAAFIASTRWEFGADFRPGGGSVAFVSARGGHPQIWTADSDGGNLRQLQELGASAIDNLRWSPRGDRLACNVVVGGRHRLAVVDPAGGEPFFPTTGFAEEVFGSWSADGDALLVGANAGSGWQVYRLPMKGGTALQITRAGGLVAEEDATGRVLYFTRPGRPGLWRRETGGRVTPELVLPDLLARDRFNWRLRGDRIIRVLRVGGTPLLLEHDLGGGGALLLAELPGFVGSGLAVDATADVFLYPRLGEAAGDLMLIPGWSAPPPR